MEEKEYLGNGMKFPPQVNKSTGRFALSRGSESVRESVYIILMTNRTERWLEPGFGSQLMSYTFMDTSLTMINIMARDIRDTLLSQESRIAEVDIDIDSKSKQGCLLVTINYTLAETNTKDNLVFPFYLNSVPEENHDSIVE